MLLFTLCVKIDLIDLIIVYHLFICYGKAKCKLLFCFENKIMRFHKCKIILLRAKVSQKWYLTLSRILILQVCNYRKLMSNISLIHTNKKCKQVDSYAVNWFEELQIFFSKMLIYFGNWIVLGIGTWYIISKGFKFQVMFFPYLIK